MPTSGVYKFLQRWKKKREIMLYKVTNNSSSRDVTMWEVSGSVLAGLCFWYLKNILPYIEFVHQNETLVGES